jgi:hypothetical protein
MIISLSSQINEKYSVKTFNLFCINISLLCTEVKECKSANIKKVSFPFDSSINGFIAQK